ncbi:unnamed protein product [Caenorhabditis brenneri]
MTNNVIRSRQRHKMVEEETTEESEEYPPSTSYCQQDPPNPPEHQQPTEDESETTPRTLRIMSDNRHDDLVVDDSNTTMRHRRRCFVNFRRTRRRKPVDDDASTTARTTTTLGSTLKFHRPMLILLVLCAIFKPTISEAELRCGPVDIRNKPWNFRQQWSRLGDPNAVNFMNKSVVDCTVVEGSFSISFIYQPQNHSAPRIRADQFPRFPKLKEITGTLLVFETNALKNLRDVFPNLRVIGGQTLIQHFSVIIYRNVDLEILGLDKLTVIRNGGVRIQDNKKLCHPKTIDWKGMIQGPINDVMVDDAAAMSVSETGKLCPIGCDDNDKDFTKCRYLNEGNNRIQSCWNDTTCDLKCDHEFVEGKAGPSGPGCDPFGNRCHEQCLGGCDKANDAGACSACQHFHYNGKCVEECAKHLYVLMDRRCVSKEECLSYNPHHKNVKVPIKATAGLCSDRCPNGYEIDKTNPHACKKCDGKCVITCTIDHVIDSFPKALALKRCNIIEGNLSIEMRGKQDSGMAAQLKDVFGNIQVITGYLRIQRSTPFLSFAMFKSLKRIEARSLYNNKYAVVVVENQNLRRLFESYTKFTIGRGTVFIHNNRMLCFIHVENLMKDLGIFEKHTVDDQSPESNGDKAICQDMVIEVNVTETFATTIFFEWPGFNTTNMDHRKFLGYELYYKEVPAIDPNMSIDDDRSACVDTWSSIFIEHRERDDMAIAERITAKLDAANRIRPNTLYAYYVATQMVHHAGARNGISKIGFAKTKFSVPDAPVFVNIISGKESISVSWDPPHITNGEIGFYHVTWRAVEASTDEMVKGCCLNDRERNTDDKSYQNKYDMKLAVKEDAVSSFVSKIKGEEQPTCSAIENCCECSAVPAAAPAGKSGPPDHATTVEQANFENTVMDTVLVQRCDIEKDPMGCTMGSRPPEQEIIHEEEEDEDSTPSGPREEEAFRRHKRSILMDDVHGLRATSRRQYDQFTALLIDTLRSRRSIENANRVSKELEREEAKEKKQQKKAPPRKLVYKDKKTTPTTTTTTTTSTTTTVPTTTTTRVLKYDLLPPLVNENSEIFRKMNTIYDISSPNDTHRDSSPLFGINVTDGNSYTITGLKHYTLYGISIAACQVRLNTSEYYCSPTHKAGVTKLTLPIYEMDRIDNNTIRVSPGNNSRQLLVKWDPPQYPNGGIRGYMIQLDGINHKDEKVRCKGASSGWSPAFNGVTIDGLTHGFYKIKIKTISLSGIGPEAEAILDDARIIEPSWVTVPMIIGFLSIVLFIATAIGVGTYYWVQIHYGKKVKALADFMHLNPEYCVDNEYTPDDWELDPASVTMMDQIGEGSFGKVYIGMGKNCQSLYGCTFGPCAIKINVSDAENAAENQMNYLMEATIMKNFKTNFIVKLYGVISTFTPAWVVMEMMEKGNLRDYLRAKREDEIFNEMDCNFFDVIPREKFTNWAAMICDGMAYLESLKFCHRDLAARNCMIDANEVVKIGDFGMARDLFYHDYYKPSGKRMMPVRWMSPESLKDGKFDSKSDVWSFGVVLYEMVTLGAQPYIGLSNDEVLNYIGMSRKIIRKPECCSDYWYKIMKMCWRYSSRDRPTFLQLVHLLSAEASPEFKEMSFVLTENQMAMEDSEPLDLDQIDIWEEPEPEKTQAQTPEGGAPKGDESDGAANGDYEIQDPRARRNTDSIPMKQFKTTMPTSPSTLSVDSGAKKQQKNPDDEYQLMTHSRGPSDNEVRHYGTDHDGDYVERDVHNDVPTRRNTGASTSSYTGGPYCLSNRGGSNERAGFGEGLRLTDNIGSGHLHDDNDYVEKDLSSMDTRRSTGASTASYGVPQVTNWSGTRGATYYANKQQQAAQAAAAAAAALAASQQQQHALLNGRGDRLTQLPGTGNLPAPRGRDEDYIETMPRNNGGGRNQGSPSRNGNTGPNRGSFNGRSAFGENERLIEDIEHPLS